MNPWREIEDGIRRVLWGRTREESLALARREAKERERRACPPRIGGFYSKSEPPHELPVVDGGPAPGARPNPPVYDSTPRRGGGGGADS